MKSSNLSCWSAVTLIFDSVAFELVVPKALSTACGRSDMVSCRMWFLGLLVEFRVSKLLLLTKRKANYVPVGSVHRDCTSE